MSRDGRDDTRTDVREPTARTSEPREPRSERPRVPMERLTLPRGQHREPVLARGHVYRLGASEARALATVGTFRVVRADDLQPMRSSRDAWTGVVRALADQGLVQIRTIEVNRASTAVVVLTRAGRDLLEAHRTPDMRRAQAFHAGLVKPREIAHDSQLFRLYQAEAERIEGEGGRVTRVVLDYELKREYQRFLHRPDCPEEADRTDEIEAFSTEDEKVDLFAARYGVPTSDLPQRLFTAAPTDASSTTRYFLDKLPVAVMGDPPVAYFVCLVTDTTGRSLGHFLKEHGRLFAWLPAWTVVAIGASPTGLHASEAAFQRYQQQPTATVTASTEDLAWFFHTREAVERGDVARFSVAEIDRFRTFREAFRRPIFDELYLEWRRHGDRALAQGVPTHQPSIRSVGTLLTELLPFDYSQFGSLPGVA